MSWTDERVRQLIDLWEAGIPTAEIAAKIGGVSKNAVIGKAHRLLLRKRDPFANQFATRQQHRKKTALHCAQTEDKVVETPIRENDTSAVVPTVESVAAPSEQQPDNVVVPISRRLRLTQLTENTCRWPTGDPFSSDFSFCGNSVGKRSKYCTYHARLAYQPISERRRNR